MAPTKLTEAEKETIFRLYRETDETTSTLSRQYGVSVSTITRLLKSKLPLEEYEDLVRSKRSGLNRSSEDAFLDVLGDPEESGGDPADPATSDLEDRDEPEVPTFSSDRSFSSDFTSDRSFSGDASSDVSGDRRRRRRSSVASEEQRDQSAEHFPEPQGLKPQGLKPQQLDLLASSLSSSETAEEIPGDPSPGEREAFSFGQSFAQPSLQTSGQASGQTSVQRPILRKPQEPDLSVDSALEEDEEDDEDYVYSFGDEEFGDDEDDFEEDEDSEDQSLGLAPLLGQNIEILALSEAHLPRVCYLVIDRTGELVTCRLQDFRELGQIPEAEAHHRTLPLFDNHRIARRFSRRTQRVIKLPDGKMVQKTARWLEAKGITRLLLDGKVYNLQS